MGIHSFGHIGAHPESHTFVDWAIAAASSNGVIWAVPVFVMLSGALTLTPRVQRNGPAAFLRRRAVRLIPALVFWTFFYLVIVRIILLGEHVSLRQAVVILIDGTPYPHLYFLYLIAGLSLVAPVLAPFLHAGGRRRALVFGAVVLSATVLILEIPQIPPLNSVYQPIVLGTLTFWIAYVGYYVLGYALSLVVFGRVTLFVSGAIFVTCWAVVMLRGWSTGMSPRLDAILSPVIQPIEAVLAVTAFVLGIGLLRGVRLGPRLTRVVVILSEASFGVFLIHLLVLLLPYELLPGLANDTSLWQTVLGYLVTLVLSFAVVLLARRVPGLRVLF